VSGVGGVETDKWLETDFHRPLEICERMRESFGGDSSKRIYQYLLEFGMYRPNHRTQQTFMELKEQKAWERLEKLFLKYKNKWQGPDVPVYLFPKNIGGIFSTKTQDTQKSGVSFEDKVFLFISPLEDEKELEALFVHEYHHVCRLNKQKKKVKDYTLLDSVVLEGLAENAVFEQCGEKYLAKWCTQYSSKELSKIWNQVFKEQLECKKTSRLHDDLLFGLKKYPPMIGYALGYKIVTLFKEKNILSTEESFILPSKKFVKDVAL
jgi:uncharacterized protein YjaZ